MSRTGPFLVGVIIGAGGLYLAGLYGLISLPAGPVYDNFSDTPPPEPSPPLETPAPAPLDFSELQPALEPILELTPLPEPAPAEPAAAPLVPQPVTPGLLYDWSGQEAVAPLSIVTSAGRDYYVKLVYAGTNDAVIGLYVLGGVTQDITVPLGTYEMRYASGTTWYGYTDLFGPETAYAKADTTFDFREETDGYTGYTVELILQEGGNLNTLSIGPEQF